MQPTVTTVGSPSSLFTSKGHNSNSTSNSIDGSSSISTPYIAMMISVLTVGAYYPPPLGMQLGLREDAQDGIDYLGDDLRALRTAA